jgi:hypothetical protein
MREGGAGRQDSYPTGAFGLYESLGFRPLRDLGVLARPFDGD